MAITEMRKVLVNKIRGIAYGRLKGARASGGIEVAAPPYTQVIKLLLEHFR